MMNTPPVVTSDPRASYNSAIVGHSSNLAPAANFPDYQDDYQQQQFQQLRRPYQHPQDLHHSTPSVDQIQDNTHEATMNSSTAPIANGYNSG